MVTVMNFLLFIAQLITSVNLANLATVVISTNNDLLDYFHVMDY